MAPMHCLEQIATNTRIRADDDKGCLRRRHPGAIRRQARWCEGTHEPAMQGGASLIRHPSSSVPSQVAPYIFITSLRSKTWLSLRL